jgi:hypothetical protein
MRISRSMRAAGIALVTGVALVATAPTVGASPADSGATSASPTSASSGGGDNSPIIIRREGPLGSIESTPAPVVPDLSSSSGAGASDGFDWGDAAIGAGAALSLVLLASGALLVTRRRGQAETQPA